jgi:hypothetical protein
MQKMVEDEEKQKKKKRPIKVRNGCWKRQQRLLDMQDEGGSVYDLENTITRPASNRNIKTVKPRDPVAMEDALNHQAGVTLNVGSIADALTLLAVASRLKIPEHLAETLQIYSYMPQKDKERPVRQAIATRQEHKYGPEDFAAVHQSFSLNTFSSGNTGTVSYSHRDQILDVVPSSIKKTLSAKNSDQKKRNGSKKTTASTFTHSSHSMEPKSTLASQRDTFEDSYVQASTVAAQTESCPARKETSAKLSKGKRRMKAEKNNEVDEMSANLNGLSVSVSSESESIVEDASDIALPPVTSLSQKASNTIAEPKRSSSRSQKLNRRSQSDSYSHSSSSASRSKDDKAPSTEETMNLEGTLTSPSKLDIIPVTSGQASVGMTALSSPSTYAQTRAGSEDDRSYPSLKPTDAFTVSSRKAYSSSRKRHSPSPSTVFMSYTLSDNEESDTSMRRNTKINPSFSGPASTKDSHSGPMQYGKESSSVIGKGKTKQSKRSNFSGGKSIQSRPKQKSSATLGEQESEDYESYATSNAPIQPVDSRRKYDTSFSESGSTDLEDKDPNIRFASEGEPPMSYDDISVQTGPSERFASDYRPLKGERYPSVEYDLSRPFSSDYEDTSYVESEVREKPSSPRRHPAMEDYEASNRMLRQEEESMYTSGSLISAEQSSYQPSRKNRRNKKKHRDDAEFSKRNSIETHRKFDSAANLDSTSGIRNAYATMTEALRTGKHEGRLTSSRKHFDTDPLSPLACGGFQIDKTRNEEEEDLDQWLESAMATKSFDDGCTLDARQFGEADDGDLDAWLDNVICR